MPALDVDYLSFLAVGLTFEEKLAAAQELTEVSSNWRYACELGADLARVGALDAAIPVLKIADRMLQRRRPRADTVAGG
jgi:hypothetical protein